MANYAKFLKIRNNHPAIWICFSRV